MASLAAPTEFGKSYYVWATIHSDAPEQLMLIDTGASISILPKSAYESIPAAHRKPLQPTMTEIMAGNNSQISVHGIAEVEFSFQHMTFTHPFFVCGNDTLEVIGMDFLRKEDVKIYIGQRQMFLRNRSVKLFDLHGARLNHRVVADRTIHIPPGCQVNIEGRVRGKGSVDGQPALLEPAATIFPKTGALVCKIAVKPTQSRVPVRIINANEEPITIYKDTTLGILREAHGFKKFTPEEEIPTKEQRMSAAQVVDRDVINTTTDSATSTTLIDGDETDELPNLLDADDVNHPIEIDVPTEDDTPYHEMPEHVKGLYERSIDEFNEEQKKKLRDLLIEYEDIFAKHGSDLGRTNLVKHHIETGDERPVRQHARRLPQSQYEEMRKQVQTLADHGVIRPSYSDWASNVILVKKKDGSWRMCVDYRELNAKTKNIDPYLLPRIDNTIDSLSRAKFFCTLDLIQGYHQVELSESSKPKTAFITPRMSPSQWEYNYMPFGVMGGPSTFQRLMDRLLQGLEYRIALAYLDDIIVFGKTIEECIDRLRQVFERIRAAQLKLKAKKCSLFQKETLYLGHVVSSEGVKCDPAKIEAVKNWREPRTVKQVRSFLGMANYYNRFIKNFADTARHLYALTKKKTKFVFSEQCRLAFVTLKEKLISAPIIAYPLEEGLFVLDTDASAYAIGGVLSQMQPNEQGVDEERVIAYGSKTLQEREQRYCTRRRELLAIVHFVKHYRPYLYGRKVLIRTDHASLRYIKTLKDPNDQFARWIERLEEIDYTIEIRQGIKHTNADSLSRIDCTGKKCICEGVADLEATGDCDDSAGLLPVETHKHIKIAPIVFRPVWTNREMAEAQRDDTDLRTVYAAKKEDKPQPTWNEVSGTGPHGKVYWVEYKRLEMHNELLYRRWESHDGKETRLQLIVPHRYRNLVCSQFHDSLTVAHMGSKRTQKMIRQRYYWHLMKDDVDRWIRTCVRCQHRKRPMPTPRAPLVIYVVGHPNERVSMDICGPIIKTKQGNEYILAITDHFTKYTRAVAMPRHTAKHIAEAFVTNWTSWFGSPMQIHTDQGPDFESKLIHELCYIMDTEKTRTTAYRPSADGQVERYNQTMAQLLNAVCDNYEDWDLKLPFVVSAYNATPHSVTGYSPNRLMVGREVYLPIDVTVPKDPKTQYASTDVYVDRLEDDIRIAFEIVRERLGKAAILAKKYYDRKSHLIRYKIGDVVLIKNNRREKGTGKLTNRYSDETFFVIDCLSDVNFRVAESKTSRAKVVHHDRMKPFYPREATEHAPDWVFERSKTKFEKPVESGTQTGMERDGEEEEDDPTTEDLRMEQHDEPERELPVQDVSQAPATRDLCSDRRQIKITVPESADVQDILRCGRGRPRKRKKKKNCMFVIMGSTDHDDPHEPTISNLQ